MSSTCLEKAETRTGKSPVKRRFHTSTRIRHAALPFGSLLLFLFLWELLAASGTWSETLVPPPVKVWDAFIEVSTTNDGVRGYGGTTLIENLGISLRRIALGAGIGIALGVVFGLVMGTVGWVRSLFEPWITFLRTLPPLAYFSLLIIWLGINECPGTIALDLPIDLPRGDIDAEQLRNSTEFAELRAQVAHAVKTTAA
jgi:taurine transport system permease protein